MTFDRDAWLPLAKRIYDDNPYTYEFSRGADGSRTEFSERSRPVQDLYVARAVNDYAPLVPDATNPLVLSALKSELNRVTDELEAANAQGESLAEQVARVRELLRELPTHVAAQVSQALYGPARCEARSGGDLDARCEHPRGHGPVGDGGYFAGQRTFDHSAPGVWWMNR